MSVLPAHLQALEHEAVYVIREAAAQCERLALLFSGGKDSAVLAWLARKACYPARLTIPLLHIDTGHNFPETLAFRDAFAALLDCRLDVRLVQESIDRRRAREEDGPFASRNRLQTVTLLDAIAELHLDAVFGGARRDEERARAKERVYSHRNQFGQWDPRLQRPELWHLFNGHKQPGEHFRIFPLSNWTELDVWEYIAVERIPLPSLYFASPRAVFERAGVLLAQTPHSTPLPHEIVTTRQVRFRTVGDATCTGAIESAATTIAAVIEEIRVARVSERGSRSDDQRSDAAMEDRKREGYF
jgi:sulfate adenylyltransferase subunit 2